jgi:glycosyltransferase involved in cell wall biosynthesis
MAADFDGYSVAVILPCFNEGAAIRKVVGDFRRELPGARVYVFDNNSTDDTAAVARAAGAKVIHVQDRGKGNVVRRMFADVEADIYVMADGDGTYDATKAPQMVEALIDAKLDMVVGTRVPEGEGQIYRFGHLFGNSMLTGMVAWIFGHGFTDMLSGFRVLSRRYVKSFPAISRGFEIETELTIHALELRAPYREVATPYLARIEGTQSKLSTFRDGARIARTILRLYVRERPRQVFLLFSFCLAISSLALGVSVSLEYIETGLVPRLPTAIVAAVLFLASMLSGICAIVLDSVVTGRSEAKRLSYLAIAAVAERKT